MSVDNDSVAVQLMSSGVLNDEDSVPMLVQLEVVGRQNKQGLLNI